MKRGMILIIKDQAELLEEMFKLPEKERDAFLHNLVKEKKAVYLGSTDKSAPELATELLKKGIRAKSYIKGNKNECNNP